MFHEHTILPQIAPLQIVIIGNVALVNDPGEPSNISGLRIERLVAEYFEERGFRKVIVNGDSNENIGYMMTLGSDGFFPELNTIKYDHDHYADQFYRPVFICRGLCV
ncbi:MAG: hypothetical protein GY751_15635 [Bacteroidetes bacterium]|nr:hypothetical protein [Bacteroidota bacterium]